MRPSATTAAALAAALAACGQSTEAPTVMLPVASAGGPLAVATTDLGYEVTTTRLRVAIADLELTIAGEQHAVAAGFYHPGHHAGGDVAGAMPGNVLVDWDGGDGRALGVATLIVGAYQGANFRFRAADGGDGLATDDPLLGHTFHVTGVARKDGADHPFDALLDLAAGTTLVGAVFELVVTEASTETLHLAARPVDPTAGGTIYDGLDFAALATTPAGLVEIRPGSTAHNVFRRPIQTHDHYVLHP